MKRMILIWTLSLISVGLFSNEQVRLSSTKDLCTPRSVYLSLPRVNPDDIDSLKNVIKFNHGDSIVELYSPPIKNQGSSQESCAGWAFGYGCASIQAYNKYQDWNWAKRSPAYLYNQVHDGTTCGPVKVNILLDSLVNQGVCSYYLMPYDETDCNTQPNATQRADAALNKSLRLSLNDTTDILEYKQLLRMGHPIGVLTKYATDLQTLCATPSAHGVWTSIVNTDTTKSHVICIVGFDDHQRLFKAMNSWGTNSGDSGFVWINYYLVENGIFSEAYILEYRSNGFVPQLEGSTYFCGSEECYAITNVPAGCSYSWSINSNYTPGDVISSGQGTDSVCIQSQGLSPSKGDDRLFPNLPRSVLSVTISDPNNNTYSISKSIYDPSPKPIVSASNAASSWTVGTTRTFTITNCSSVSFSNLQWIIKKTVYPLFGNPTIYTDTIYGTYMTYTPTWTSGATSITIDITATNLARHCEDNYVLLSFNVVRKLLLKATDTGDYLDVAISDTETESSLYHIEFNANSLYTLELWHPMYGLMRTKPAYNANEQIDINGLPQGVYILLLKENNHIIAQTKVII